jgi:hypothetical protein
MYRSAYQLQQKIDSYFKNPPKSRLVYDSKGKEYRIGLVSISGLALYLGFCDRYSFYDYEKIPKFTHTIKKARAKLTAEYEEQVSQGNSCAIFMLKNLGYSDKQIIEQQGDPNQSITVILSDKTIKT